MKRLVLGMLAFMLAASCSAMSQKSADVEAQSALSLCVAKMKKLSGKPLSKQIDRAYVYMLSTPSQGIWVSFAHGEIGEFAKRSEESGILLDCGLIKEPKLNLVFLGDPFGKVLLQTKGSDELLNGDLRGSRVILYKRVDGKFRFDSSHNFSARSSER